MYREEENGLNGGVEVNIFSLFQKKREPALLKMRWDETNIFLHNLMCRVRVRGRVSEMKITQHQWKTITCKWMCKLNFALRSLLQVHFSLRRERREERRGEIMIVPRWTTAQGGGGGGWVAKSASDRVNETPVATSTRVQRRNKRKKEIKWKQQPADQ